MKNNVQLREEYVNRLRNVQFKRRDKQEDFIIIALLMALIIDYFSVKNKQNIVMIVPFIDKVDMTKPKIIVNQIEQALEGKGELFNEVEKFKQISNNKISSLTNIIPQKPKKINIKPQNTRSKALKEKAEFMNESNDLNVKINKYILGKTKKQWNTQRDSRVRKTKFHRGIDRQIVNIDAYFQVDDLIARHPSDITYLPPYDYIGCRCYLTFI